MSDSPVSIMSRKGLNKAQQSWVVGPIQRETHKQARGGTLQYDATAPLLSNLAPFWLVANANMTVGAEVK